MRNKLYKKIIGSKKNLLLPMVLFALPALANGGKPAPTALDNPLAQILLIIIVFLAVAIGIMVNALLGAVEVYKQRMKKQSEQVTKAVIAVLVSAAFLFSDNQLLAQDNATAVKAVETINGLSLGTFYTMIGVIGVEIIILISLTYNLKFLVGIESKRKVKEVQEIDSSVPQLTWWDKFNKSVALDKEKDIDLDHEYDGIRELDNPIPPWWKLAFLITVVFGVAYLYRYHVSKSAPLQIEEFTIAMNKAEEEKAEYLRTAASKVDENTVVMLGEGDIAAGKSLFVANCGACHGNEGQGTVGPNLADDYWIHGGSLSDIFKSIKYGWADKGMRSWKEDFSPSQIAQISSFVKSLRGTNPTGAKEPQGELYVEESSAANSDSTSVK